MDVVLSICLQSDFPTGQIVKQSFAAKGNPPSQNDPSGPTRGMSQRLPRDRRATKRKDSDSKLHLLIVYVQVYIIYGSWK